MRASAASATYSETVGPGGANTWTNYTNAGGYEGPHITEYSTVQIACRLQGFRVADGNTWWYQIAQSPWSYQYYVSADAFYNNGQTSGSLKGTPFVDPNVRECGTGSGKPETTGGETHTWSNYSDAGGSAGPTIGGGGTVLIACRVEGFRVADGNTWWYQIAQSPWNNAYYASADAFYNNGQTSGSLEGTPFVDTTVPLCGSGGNSGEEPAPPSAATYGETAGGNANTWTNPANAGGTQGPTVAGGSTVQIACKLEGFRVADGNTWWYRIASAPWSGSYYVSADAFYNNGVMSGSLLGTPFVDPRVPNCTEASAPRPPGETVGPGGANTWANYSHAGAAEGPHIPEYSTVTVSCRVTGFVVADGNPWWYEVSTSPWDNVYYVSADAFYNNGATTGSLKGTPWVDPSVPICAGNQEAPIYSTAYGSSHASGHSTGCTNGDPVNCASGDFWQTFTDVKVSGLGPGLEVSRTYNDLTNEQLGIFGYGWSSSLDQHLTLTEKGSVVATLDDGSQITAVPNGEGGYSLPAQTDATLSHNENGTYTLVEHAVRTLIFTATGQLSAIRDRDGNQTTFGYNEAGRLQTLTDATGRTVRIEYGSNGLVSRVTDPLGRVTTYGYDATKDLSEVTDPLGRTWHFKYNGSHEMLGMEDPRGGMVTNTYDELGRVLTQTDPAGLVTTYAYSGEPYSSVGGTTTITEPHGRVKFEQYVNGFMTEVTQGVGSANQGTWLYTYDPNTWGVTQSEDPDGHTNLYTYDATGQVLTATNPDGYTSRYTYNSFQEPLTETTALGHTTSREYDADGDLTAVTTPLGARTTYRYEDSAMPGLPTQMTDPEGRTTRTTYDSHGDVASESREPSAGVHDTVTYGYDGDGEKTCEGSADAYSRGVSCPAVEHGGVEGTTSLSYNLDGEQVGATDPEGHTTKFEYDEDGDKISETDRDGHVTTSAYDLDGRLTRRAAGVGTSAEAVTSYAYDLTPGEAGCPNGSGIAYCTSSTNPTHGVTVSAYNAREELVALVRPGGQTTTYTYEPAGRKATMTDAQGRTTSYAYDNAGQLTNVTYSEASTHEVRYGYNADGLRTSMSDATGTTEYEYDNDGQLSREVDGSGATAGYEYDAAGNIVAITYPAGKVDREYDGADRLVAVTDWLGNTTKFAYDADGNLTHIGYPDKDTATNAYNAEDALTNTAAASETKTLASLAYARDGDQQITQETGRGALAGSITYTYDARNDLTGGGTTPYSYDASGDLTGNGATSQTYNTEQEVTSAAASATSEATEYTYDREGQRTALIPVSGPATRYSYDQAGNMIGVSQTAGRPQVTSLKPTLGASVGGTLVKIKGTNLGTTGAITFGGTPGRDLNVVSPDEVTVIAPPHGVGATSVRVQTAEGTSPVTTKDTYTFREELAVGEVQPGTGPATGGNTVTITGTELGGVTAVLFGRAKATSVDVISAHELTADTPAGSGTVNVIVTAGSKTSKASAVAVYQYTAGTGGSANREPRLLGARRDAASQPLMTPVSYTYNGDGLRMTAAAGGETTNFVWDTIGHNPSLLADSTNDYIYGPEGAPIEQIPLAGGSPVYLFHDGMGSTRMLLSASGTVVGSKTYTPYGAVKKATGSAGTPFGWSGGYADETTHLVYLVHRYYDPSSGQFLSVDPELETTEAPYRYAEDDPINGGDPSGLSWWNPLSWSPTAHYVIDAVTRPIVGFVDSASSAVAGYVSATETCFDSGWGSDNCSSATWHATLGALNFGVSTFLLVSGYDAAGVIWSTAQEIYSLGGEVSAPGAPRSASTSSAGSTGKKSSSGTGARC